MLGLRTVCYPTPDLATGRAWYARAFDTEPYFAEPFYVGFNIGGFELGLIPDGTPGATGGVAYWGVNDVDAELKRLVGIGAKIAEAAHEVGGGIIVGSVIDPFGNTLGLIYNPHFQREEVK